MSFIKPLTPVGPFCWCSKGHKHTLHGCFLGWRRAPSAQRKSHHSRGHHYNSRDRQPHLGLRWPLFLRQFSPEVFVFETSLDIYQNIKKGRVLVLCMNGACELWIMTEFEGDQFHMGQCMCQLAEPLKRGKSPFPNHTSRSEGLGKPRLWREMGQARLSELLVT